MLLLIFAAGCAIVMLFVESTVSQLLGWLGIGVYLLLKGQVSLFWAQIVVPVALGIAGLILFPEGIPEAPFGDRVVEVGWLEVFLRYVTQAGLGMSMLILPLSLLGVDPA